MVPRLTCAVVDDDPDWLELIRRSLSMSRLSIVPIKFRDGLSALRYLRRERVDFVVTDLQMPGIDGLTLIDELRSFDKTTPVILISSDESASGGGLTRGANAFVRKGALNTHLTQTVEALLGALKRDATTRTTWTPSRESA